MGPFSFASLLMKGSDGMKLTAKQERFVQEYLIDLNATQAAIRAGYSRKTAGVIGVENLKKPYIREAIEEKLKQSTMRRQPMPRRYASSGRES